MHEKDPTFPTPSPNGLSFTNSHESNRFSFAKHDDRTPTTGGQSWYEPSLVSDDGHDVPDRGGEKYDEEQQDEDDDVEQKLSVKALIPVTVALCAALFCMSLVSETEIKETQTLLNPFLLTMSIRIRPSSQQLFPKLLVNSTRWTMSPGTVAHIFSPPALCS